MTHSSESTRNVAVRLLCRNTEESVLDRTDLLNDWEANEVRRETRVVEPGGEYYEHGPLALALVEVEEQKAKANALQTQLELLQSELNEIRRSFLYGKTTKLLSSRLIRRLHETAFVIRIERRIRHRRSAGVSSIKITSAWLTRPLKASGEKA